MARIPRHGARGRRGDAPPHVGLGHLRGPKEDEQAPGNGRPRGGRARGRASQAGLPQGQRPATLTPGFQRPWVQARMDLRVGRCVCLLARTAQLAEGGREGEENSNLVLLGEREVMTRPSVTAVRTYLKGHLVEEGTDSSET